MVLLLIGSVNSISIFINYCLLKSAAKGNLSTTLISLPQLIGFYTGFNIAWLITDIIIKYYIKENIGAFIMDNAKNNNKLIKIIIIIFPTINPKWTQL